MSETQFLLAALMVVAGLAAALSSAALHWEKTHQLLAAFVDEIGVVSFRVGTLLLGAAAAWAMVASLQPLWLGMSIVFAAAVAAYYASAVVLQLSLSAIERAQGGTPAPFRWPRLLRKLGER